MGFSFNNWYKHIGLRHQWNNVRILVDYYFAAPWPPPPLLSKGVFRECPIHVVSKSTHTVLVHFALWYRHSCQVWMGLLDLKNTFSVIDCMFVYDCHVIWKYYHWKLKQDGFTQYMILKKVLKKNRRREPHERICRICKSGDIENELHFLCIVVKFID